jgi:hypothetical protein
MSSIRLRRNFPVVYDVFAVAIKEREAFQQPQKCGGAKHHKGRSPTGVLRNPTVGSAYNPVRRRSGFTELFFTSIKHDHHYLLMDC